jgi:hypothetical protein
VSDDTDAPADASDAASPNLGDEAGPGEAAPTNQGDLPAAADHDANADSLVGDFTDPDVDTSGLVPADDGEPDDDEDPAPVSAETVDQDATGQATVLGSADWHGDAEPGA